MINKSLSPSLRCSILVALVALYIRLVGWTTRIKRIGEEHLPPKPFIYILWHSRIMFLTYSHRARAHNILVSTSKDGDISAGVNRHFGHRIIRGTASSPEKARRSLIKLIRKLRENKVVCITPDGPKGPAYEVKKGIPFIAQKTGFPVVPVAYSMKRKKILNTWDRLLFPLPFNSAVLVTGKPVYVARNEDLDTAAKKIHDSLNEVTSLSDRIVQK
jgi:lysophospholipid acyltransferase (LPLAT)-like uncharacterized protein